MLKCNDTKVNNSITVTFIAKSNYSGRLYSLSTTGAFVGCQLHEKFGGKLGYLFDIFALI